jgi:hypothetical protein
MGTKNPLQPSRSHICFVPAAGSLGLGCLLSPSLGTFSISLLQGMLQDLGLALLILHLEEKDSVSVLNRTLCDLTPS